MLLDSRIFGDDVYAMVSLDEEEVVVVFDLTSAKMVSVLLMTFKADPVTSLMDFAAVFYK